MKLVWVIVATILVLAACQQGTGEQSNPDGEGEVRTYVDYFPPPGAPDAVAKSWVAIGPTCPKGTHDIVYDAGGACIYQSSREVKVKITILTADPLSEYRDMKTAVEILLWGWVPRHLSEEQVCNTVWEAPAELTDRLEPSDLKTSGCNP
jgi:hypothetical protein